ncbi:MAG: 5'(3')-deoxyribonucleotidase [Bacteroidetes bacterium]|nr:5'(3')-deoxyribonucleotidase [Bacteroidota bacterium]
MKRIAVDMDEVMAEVRPKLLDLYEREFGIRLKHEDYFGKKIYEIEGAKKIRKFIDEPGFFADLPVMEDCQEVLRELMDRYEVFITTAAMEFRYSLTEKYDWLQYHFPFIHWKNFVFCGDKSIIQADYMIDDHAFNFDNFDGQGILFTTSHNIYEDRYPRVDNWKDVRSYFADKL